MKTAMRKMVYAKYNGHCAYCGREITIKEMQVDHFEPKCLNAFIGRDGNYVYADPNRYENLMPSCRRCNHYKRANSLKYFRHLIATIHERIHDNYIVKVAEDFGIVQYNTWDGLFYFEKCEATEGGNQ